MEFEKAQLTAADLYDRYLRDVYRYVSRRIPRREDAEDITAGVFEDAFRFLGRLRSVGNPRIWLYGIARRKMVDHFRKASRRRETLDCETPAGLLESIPAAAQNPELIVRQSEGRDTVRKIMNNLNEDYREVLLLQYVEGLTIAEVAQVIGRTPTAANSMLQRARAAAYKAGMDYFVPDSAVKDPPITPKRLNARAP